MNVYKKPALMLQALCLITMIFLAVLTTTHWLYPSIYHEIYTMTGASIAREFDVDSFSYMQKSLGFIVESIALGLLLYGLFLVVKVMNYVKKKQCFSLATINVLKKITTITLLYMVYAPLHGSLVTLINTWHNKPGEHMISLSFGSSDVFNIMTFCCMLLITALVQKGYELNHEQELTI